MKEGTERQKEIFHIPAIGLFILLFEFFVSFYYILCKVTTSGVLISQKTLKLQSHLEK